MPAGSVLVSGVVACRCGQLQRREGWRGRGSRGLVKQQLHVCAHVRVHMLPLHARTFTHTAPLPFPGDYIQVWHTGVEVFSVPEVVEHGMQKHGVGLAFSGSIGSLVERTSVGELGDKVSSVLQRARGVLGRRDSGQRWEKALGGGQVEEEVENSSVSGLG